MRSLLNDDDEDVEVIRPSSDVSLPKNPKIKPPGHPVTFERLREFHLYKQFQVKHLIWLLLILYLTIRVIKFLRWKILNNIVTNLGKETLEMRNGRIYSFKDDIQHLDIPKILKMDVF